MAAPIQFVTADKTFGLADGGGGVTFRGGNRHVLVQGDIAKLVAVFAGQTNLAGNTTVHDTDESRARVTLFLQSVQYLELRGARAALRTFAETRSPPLL